MQRAIEAYIKLHRDQQPAPFVVLCEQLAVAAMYNPQHMDPAVDASVADKLRKQSKSRAVRFIREALSKSEADFTINALRGHEGAHAVLSRIVQAARKQLTPITHASVQEALVFKAADRSVSAVRADHSGDHAEGKEEAVGPAKPKKARQSLSSEMEAKKNTAHAHSAADISIRMLLSHDDKRGAGFDFSGAGHDELMGDADDVGAAVGHQGTPEGSPADPAKKKKDPMRVQKDKMRIAAANAALETFDSEPVYVVGTGPACNIKKIGILRKIGGFMKIECEGQILGLKEFCNLAQNKKQIARDGVRLASNNMTLTEAIDQMLMAGDMEAQGMAGAVSSPHTSTKVSSSHGADGSKASPALSGTPGSAPAKKKKKSENAAAAAAILAQSAAKKMFESAAEFSTNEDVLQDYDREKQDFTAVMIEDRNEQIRLKKEKDMLKCKALVKSIISNRQGALFLKPIDLSEYPDYADKISTPMDLGTVRSMLEQGSYVSHEEFARDMRLVWSNAMVFYPPDSEMSETALKLSDSFEDRYATILAEAASVEDEHEKPSEMPENLQAVPQRCISDWAIFDQSGAFLPPWNGSEATSPGGLCGVLIPADGVDLPPVNFRIESPSEWRARCVDPLGNQLPEFWVCSGKVWYLLSKPIVAYKDFLMEESAWVMATYRIAAYLNHSPRASFDDVCKVLEGKGWRKGDKLVPHSIETLIKHADGVVTEITNIYPKFSGHKFCTTLLQKAQRQREIQAGPRRRESKGEASAKKRKAPEIAEEEDESILPDCGGWQWHDDLSEDEKEVRRALHGIICVLEREDGSPRKKFRGGKKGGSKSDWRCQWCSATTEQAGGKSPGPDGPGTLCAACGSRFRNGHKGPPMQDEDGWFVCDLCNKTFQSIRGLGSHRRSCVGPQWRCDWCGCLEQETSTKCQGPGYVFFLCACYVKF
jgi:hypothetical protein